MKIQSNVFLSPHTTINCGGLSKYYVNVKSIEDLLEAVKYSRNNNIPLFILSGGSNVLISDEGFNGLTIKIDIKGINKIDEEVLEVSAGEIWDDFVSYTVKNNLWGIECLSGVPGLVGTSPVQNIGCYGQEVKDTILKVKVLDTQNLTIKEFNNKDCKFDYRNSLFKNSNRYIVLSVTYKLIKDKYKDSDKDIKFNYKDLVTYFENKPKPTIMEIRDAVFEIRRNKSMLYNKNDPNSISVGSFFITPIVSKETFNKIQKDYPNVIYYESKDNNNNSNNNNNNDNSILYKIPGGWLIENAGFAKGYQKGRVGLSDKHCLSIINKGNATTSEIIDFGRYIRDEVYKKFEVELKPEPVFVGFADSFVF